MSYPFDPDWVVHPGATLREWFAEIGLPHSVAQLHGIDKGTLNGIFDGSQKISPALAQKLCNLTHVGAPFWLAYDHNFRVGRAAGKQWDPDE